MDNSSRFPAFLAYLLPVVGWVYALVAHRKNSFVVFHAKQAIGLVLFLVLVFAGWAVAGYLLAMIPYLAIIASVMFTLVIAAFIFGLVAWIMGMLNALRGIIAFLPIFGHKANTLPF
jgi:uncharacterized membrane protein